LAFRDAKLPSKFFNAKYDGDARGRFLRRIRLFGMDAKGQRPGGSVDLGVISPFEFLGLDSQPGNTILPEPWHPGSG
jgi:hypothetical protein